MTRRLLTIAVLLTASWAVCWWMTRDSAAPAAPHLEQLPRQMGNWTLVSEPEISPETLRVLRADGTLRREYELAPGCRVRLFIAYYRTQHAGESMHSPRNCLPGSGWEPVSRSSFLADLGNGRRRPINRYLVEKDGSTMLVMYWYQVHDRIIADEYSGKLYLMWDSIRRKQRDGALVRVTVPLHDGLSEEQATAQIALFLRSAAPEITATLFPSMGQ